MRSRKDPLFSIPTTLPEAIYSLVHNSTATPEQQAAEIGCKPGYLYNAANPHLAEDFHFKLRWLLPLTRLTRNFVVLDFIERALGRVAVMLPVPKTAVEPATVENLPGYICQVMGEIGELVKVSQERIKDHHLSHEDRVRIKKEVRDVVQRAMQIDVALGDE